MKIINLVAVTALAAALAACGGGSDINLGVDDEKPGDNNNGTDNACASYVKDGTTLQGTFEAPNCVYDTDFVGLANPYTGTEELVFSDLADDGVHIFNESLVVGQNYNNDADMAAAAITQGGDGSTIRLEGGSTLAFRSNDD